MGKQGLPPTARPFACGVRRGCIPAARLRPPRPALPPAAAQGVVLDCSALEFEALGELPAPPAAGDAGAAGRQPVWLCLDEVMDPVRGRGAEGWVGQGVQGQRAEGREGRSVEPALHVLPRRARRARPERSCIPALVPQHPQQNFGAALRSAYYLGVAGVLACHRNSAPLSAAVSKASSGAMELMAVHSCKCVGAGAAWVERCWVAAAAVQAATSE